MDTCVDTNHNFSALHDSTAMVFHGCFVLEWKIAVLQIEEFYDII